jgi:uncharacterized damage-inducible protein DinB
MLPQAQLVWDGLQLRTPTLLRSIEPLSETQIRWQPPNGGSSIAWLLWHIPEVEDNWVRDKLYGLPKRYPFGASVRQTNLENFPSKGLLLAYFEEVRALTKKRLEEMSDVGFDRMIRDETYGEITVRQLWGAVVTSCAWHSGQIVFLANRLVPK